MNYHKEATGGANKCPGPVCKCGQCDLVAVWDFYHRNYAQIGNISQMIISCVLSP